jgi:MYXO-CTERM domain-containing protein
VDESHGDAYTVWVAQGMPASPSTSELASLQQAMDPAPLTADQTLAVAADGSLGLDFDLPRFGVSLLTIAPSGADDGGVDAASGDGASSPPPRSGGGCGCRAAGPDGGAIAFFALVALLLIARGGNRRAASRRRVF